MRFVKVAAAVAAVAALAEGTRRLAAKPEVRAKTQEILGKAGEKAGVAASVAAEKAGAAASVAAEKAGSAAGKAAEKAGETASAVKSKVAA